MSQKHELFTKQGEKWKLTNYGEFVSYYQAHVQILDKLLLSKEENSNEINRKKNNFRKFMKDNIKNINHFIENANKLAEFVSMNLEVFNQYMMENFLQTLETIQKTMEKQFVEKVYLEEQEKFFNESVGEGILKNTVFSFEGKIFENQNKLFLIKELKTEKEIHSSSLKKEKKAQLETQALIFDSKEIESKEREPEVQVSNETVNLLKTKKLVLESKIIDEEQIPHRDNLLDGFDDLEFELGSKNSSEDTENENFIYEKESKDQNILKEETIEPQIQNILKEETIEPQIQNILKEETIEPQIQNILKEEETIKPQIQDTFKEENLTQKQDKVKKPEENQDLISFFEYIRLLNLNKKNREEDIKIYKKWLISLKKIERSTIFIQDLLEKDLKQPIDWESSLKKVSQNIKVDYHELKQIKDSISFLFQLKREIEIFWKACHKDQPSVIPVFKNVWISFLKIFSSNIKNKKIDFNLLEQEVLNLLKEDNQKLLKKIFQYWFDKKLKKVF